MKKIIFILLVIILLWIKSYVSFSQNQQDYQLTSPYYTVTTHLKFLQNDNYHPDISAKTLDAKGLSQKEKIQLAIKLKQIYDGSGHYIEPSLIPNDPDYVDSVNHLKRYIPVAEFPEIYLIKKGNEWLYSRATVVAISKIHIKVYPFGTDKLLEITSYFNINKNNKRYLGLYIWQYVAILILIFFGFIGYKMITVLIQNVIHRLLIKRGYQKVANEVINPVAKPLSMCFILLLLSLMVRAIQLPIQFLKYIFWCFDLFIPLLFVIVCYRLIDIFIYYLQIAAAKTHSTLDDQLVPLVKKSLKLFVIITGVLFILQNLNFNITGILAGISIGGLAFALAAQDTIKNLFGSLMIFVDRPFQVGDWVVGQDINGVIEEVGFRSTRVRTFHNSVVSIPNGNIANMTVDNMGMRAYRRFSTLIAITYDTPADLIEAFVEGLKQIVINHSHTRKDYYEIHLNAFGASSLDILFYIFFKTNDWSGELNARQEIILEIIRLSERLGVRFAFPTQTVFVESFPEKESLTPVYTYTKEDWMNLIKKQH